MTQYGACGNGLTCDSAETYFYIDTRDELSAWLNLSDDINNTVSAGCGFKIYSGENLIWNSASTNADGADNQTVGQQISKVTTAYNGSVTQTVILNPDDF